MTKVKIIERTENLEEYDKEVKETLPNKLDKRVIDDTPRLDSEGLVTSDGIYRALARKQDALVIDFQLSNSSLNPIANSAISNEVNNLRNAINNAAATFRIGKGAKVFTSSGTFTVPPKVKSAKVTCVGGGGGGYLGTDGSGVSGGDGGNTSFGNYATAGGGKGRYRGSGGQGGTFSCSTDYYIGFNGSGATCTVWNGSAGLVQLENYGAGSESTYDGGGGATVVAFVEDLTPGETIRVTVGGGGKGGSSGASLGSAPNGKPGYCVVEWG